MSGKRFALLCCLMLASAVGASLAVVMLAAPRLHVAPKFVLVTSGQEAHQQAVAFGAQAAARELGVNLVVEQLSPGSLHGAAESMSGVSLEGINGIVVCQSANMPMPLAVQSLAKKTNVITCGEDASPAYRLCHFGTGDYSAGRICANMVMQALPAGGRVVVLVDDAAQGRGSERLQGLRENLKGSDGADRRGQSPRFEIGECFEDYGHVGLCARNMRLGMAQRPDAVCVVDLGVRTARSGIGPLAAIAQATGVKLVTFDRSDAALTAVEAGDVFAVIGNDPFAEGYQAIHRLASMCREGDLSRPVPGKGTVNVPAAVVCQDNIAEYRVLLAGGKAPAA